MVFGISFAESQSILNWIWIQPKQEVKLKALRSVEELKKEAL
jgi:hypothetical protein